MMEICIYHSKVYMHGHTVMYWRINCIVSNNCVNGRKVELVLKDLGPQPVVYDDRLSYIEM